MKNKLQQSKDNKKPKLRFPGFTGVWEEKRLREINSIIDGDRGANYPNGDDFTSEGYCLFLNAKNVTRNGFVFDNRSYISREKDNQLRNGKLERGDIVLTTRGSIGHIAFYDNDIVFDNIRINSGMVLLRCNPKNTNFDYMQFILNSYKIQNKIQKLSFGSAQPQLTVKGINNLKIGFPSLLEQQKIAEFLGSVDKWLENLQSQKKSLEEYKKGMMQKILSQQIRFKDENGKDFPDWEEKMLGEICKITTGKLDANAMKENGEYRFYTCAKEFYRIDKYAFDTEALLISGNGANVGYIHYYSGKFNAYQRTYVLDKFDVNIIFIKYFLEKNLNQRISNEKKDGNTPYIVMDTLSKMKIFYPIDKEQQKIAEFLGAVDNLINSKEQQITQSKNWKKGLMQELFV